MSTGKGSPLPFGLQGIPLRLRASYWFVPLLVTLAGAGLALGLLALDARRELSRPSTLWLVVYPTSAEGARQLLAAVIGSMITAISVTFSITVVALTVAAQHFGPRVLNNFIRHTSAQVVLGTFIATFVYAVLVLGAIGASGGESDLPQLAVMGAVALVIVSVGALIYYVHHISTALQVGQIAAEIAAEFTGAIAGRDEGDERVEADDEEAVSEPPAAAVAVAAARAGYVQRIDYDALVELARERGAVVWIRRPPGKFAVAGAPLALVDPPSACDADFIGAANAAFALGRDRTQAQDAEFAVKQLVEVALRALSPGVNEPFTAVTCIDRLTEGIARAAVAPPPRESWRDAAGRTRVIMQAQAFTTLLRAAFDPIRIYADRNPAIHARLLDSIGELASVTRRARDRAALRHQGEVIRRAAAAALVEPDDRAFVEERYRHAMTQFEAPR